MRGNKHIVETFVLNKVFAQDFPHPARIWRMKKSFRKGFMQVFSMGWMILIPDIIQQKNTKKKTPPIRELIRELEFPWSGLFPYRGRGWL